ncbi:gibberellin-regulated protein 14-like isoform X1 [Neltuma alba]|uniref:gibberellin-regulated protein 14-like isoform X1 n=1 Tax=Neltuma alba TaxID=207710 RepID=UPI0010A474A0|nr:gibberellin-regulated protein 14-like isoform X1 [Prosopis alba]
MASKSAILLLALFLVVATEVHSHDGEVKVKMNYVKSPLSPPPNAPPVVAHAPPPPVKPVTPPPPVVKTPYPSPPAPDKAPVPPSPVKPPVAPAPPAAPIVKSNKDCVPLCEYRCQLHSRKRVCMRACTTCCERCKCVPPGTFGNREVCGKCYTDMLTHGDRPKCP